MGGPELGYISFARNVVAVGLCNLACNMEGIITLTKQQEQAKA